MRDGLFGLAKEVRGDSSMRILIMVVSVTLILAGCGNQDETAATSVTNDTAASAPSGGSGGKYPSDKQYAWIDIGKEAIKSQLKDPDSAKFRNVAFYSGGGIPIACGEVNAKNGFGGYGGFERFVAAGDQLAFLESQVSDGIGPVWDKYCKHGPEDNAQTD